MIAETVCPYCGYTNHREVAVGDTMSTRVIVYRLCQCGRCSGRYGIRVKVEAVVDATFKLVQT